MLRVRLCSSVSLPAAAPNSPTLTAAGAPQLCAQTAARASTQRLAAALRRSATSERSPLPVLAAGATVAVTTFGAVLADDNVLHPPVQPWSHSGMLDCFDAARCARAPQSRPRRRPALAVAPAAWLRARR